MSHWRWIPSDAIRAMHADLIDRFGGLLGPGPGDLAAALERPKQHAHYQPDADAYDVAAVYADAFARGHVYADGNKRMAFTTARVFLILNKQPVANHAQAEATERTLALAAGAITTAEFASWLRASAGPGRLGPGR